MPDARAGLWNFLSENAKTVVRDEVLDARTSKGKLYGQPRIFNDLLSSQPLCFNLFAELRCDLRLATDVLRAVTRGRVRRVTAIQFEHSPGRGNPVYLGDRSAFDAFVRFDTASGGRGFVGIEVKYHENLRDRASRHRARYDEVAAIMGCFSAHAQPRLRRCPLQQVWRDHLLAGILHDVDRYDDGFFLLLHPRDNQHCQTAVASYRSCLASDATFSSLTLEDIADEIRRHTDDEWISRFCDRYLDFGKIDRLLVDP